MKSKAKTRMSMVDKHELYSRHFNDPGASYSDLAIWAATTFGPRRSRPNQPSETLLSTTKQRVFEPTAMLYHMSAAELIRKQASNYAAQLDVPNSDIPSYSKGWLYRFQQKHVLTSKIEHGEAG
ncbi:hypothetical protein H257_15856 [Aphanomyces astaci]|uniref:HTH CENPB-type domain-containing protein n=1 Tax=Aphanomyces astaci TaxID=112090 RepID=W4FKX6_APHAT|nr:hypothetical protein H257_15856 [Aphanomyces astaci]ETV68115.1 hypothetical protein H257_15856 [Aphanomyces astaci]|eukprot:XP_009842414.1 hypothetical protein H257_15856 [Aphanomyces astaci]